MGVSSAGDLDIWVFGRYLSTTPTDDPIARWPDQRWRG